MTLVLRSPAALSIILAAGCQGPRGNTDGAYSNQIIGGSVERGLPAVGAVLDERDDASCTATLVSPTVAVTAAHCLEGVRASDLSFFVGLDATDLSSGEVYAVAGAHAHPDYDSDSITNDVGVIVLAAASSVAPMPLLTAPMTDAWIGREPLFVGFGYAPESGYGLKRSVRIPITDLYDDAFEYEAEGVNTCDGDSGGPALYEVDGALTVIGVTSYGDEDCEIYGVDARVDPFVDFLSQHIAAAPPEEDAVEVEYSEGDVFGIANHSPEGRAVLYLANDLLADELDDDAALDSRAAANIVAHRAGADGVLGTADDDDFETLSELDAVSYVGQTALTRLLAYADQTGVLEAFSVTHGVREYSSAAEAILHAANTLSEPALDDDVPLDSRAAANIVAQRSASAHGLRFLHELDLVGYVGASAFANLLSYAEAQGWD